MHTLIASDKYKSFLNVFEVQSAMDRACSPYTTKRTLVPLADGGDGALQVIQHFYRDLTINKTSVIGPTGALVPMQYGWRNGALFLELAEAAGFRLTTKETRNIMASSTMGLGLFLQSFLLENTVKEVHLFCGGSATNDAAMGLASALNVNFYDASDTLLHPSGSALSKINRIKLSKNYNHYKSITWKVYSDVTSPFSGEKGAAYQFAPQKGATPEQVKILDQGLEQINACFMDAFDKDVRNVAGAGAAGGVAGGMHALFDASIHSGVSFFSDLSRLEHAIQQADLVLTGEGRMDNSSTQGKVVSELMRLGQKHNTPIVVIAGSIEDEGIQKNKNVSYVDLSKIAKENSLNSFEDFEECLKIAITKIYQP